MSRCSPPKLRDSQDLGHEDSFSLPSEPPDIRNWFSSYVYESPELNSLDCFRDSDGSGETFVEEGKNGKFGGCKPLENCNDALLAASKKSSDGIELNESDKFEFGKSATPVADSSESLSFSSEPPDIKKWFSSYVYESLPEDSDLDFAISETISNYKDKEDCKHWNVQVSCRQNKKDAIAVGAKERIELGSQSRHPDVAVKCTNLVKNSKLDHQLVSKDTHNVALESSTYIPKQFTSDKVSYPTLSGQETGNNNHGDVEMSGNTKMHGNDSDGNSHGRLIYKRSVMSRNVENNVGDLNGESVHKSIRRIGPVRDRTEKGGLHEIASPGTLDTTVSDGNSRGRPTDTRRNEKENELPENGFVCIRKKSSEAIATRGVRVEVVAKRKQEKDVEIGRKVLSEIGNMQETVSSGKWRCPQKNKPEIGPPLKQLRLSKWFYRI